MRVDSSKYQPSDSDYASVDVDAVCLSVTKALVNVLPTFTSTPFKVVTSPVPSPIITPSAIHFGVNPMSFSYTCQNLNDRPPAESVTLNTTPSNRGVAWRATIAEIAPAAQTPWAVASPSDGTVSAGQSATLTLTPVAGLCSSLPNLGQTFHATVSLPNGDGGPFTIAYEVKPPVIG
jgi:hypothetical protein